MAKLSYLIPLIGYFILFNDEIVKSLQLHTSFCTAGCNVTWRLQFFYFGGCAFAVATGLYAVRCPTLLKRYDSASDFYNNTQGFLSHDHNFKTMVRRAEAEGANISSADIISEMDRTHPPYKQAGLPGITANLYESSNRARPVARHLCLVLFAIGGVLLGVPALKTFLDVVQLSVNQLGL